MISALAAVWQSFRELGTRRRILVGVDIAAEIVALLGWR